MPLPFNPNVPEARYGYFSSSSPAPVPSIQIFRIAEGYLQSAANEIANIAMNSIQRDSVSVFAYNAISSNGWNNLFYARLLKIFMDQLVVTNAINNLTQGAFSGSAQKLFDMYAVWLASMFQELHPAVAATGVPVQQVTNSLQQMMNAAASLYMQNGMHYDIPEVFNNAQMGGFQQPQQQFQQAAWPGMGGSRRTPITNVMGGARNMGGGHAAVSGSMLRSDSIAGISTDAQSRRSHNPRTDIMIDPNNRMITENNIRSVVVTCINKEPDPVPAPKPQPALQRTEEHSNEPPVTAVIDEAMSVISINTPIEEVMDRKQHSVAYFGTTVAQPVDLTHDAFQAEINRQENMLQNGTSEISQSTWIAVDSLLEAIYDTMGFYYELIGEAITIRQRPIMVIRPIIGGKETTEVIRRLSEAGTFHELAVAMKREMESYANTNNQRSVHCVLKQINAALTHYVSNFLRHGLDGDDWVEMSESFIDVGCDLSSYLNTRFSAKYNSVFARFQRSLLSSFFKHSNEDKEDLSIAIDYGHDAITSSNPVMVNHLVSYINASREELGYEIPYEKTVTISENRFPLLYRLLSLASASNPNQDLALRHIVVLADSTAWEIFTETNGAMKIIAI